MSTRTLDSVYGEIAGLTGNRAELERERYELIKAVRSLKAVQADAALAGYIEPWMSDAFDETISRLELLKSRVWDDIEKANAGIQKLMDLAQNGAFNENR